MVVRVVTLLTSLACLASLACSSGGDGGAPTSNADAGLVADASGDVRPDVAIDADSPARRAADAACAEQSTAYCARLDQCYSAYMMAAFGDASTCAARLQLACTPPLLASGSSTTPADVRACAAALPTADCVALFGNDDPPDACKSKPGTLADRAACSFDAQCAGGKCALGAGVVCGTCTTRSASGGACDTASDCAYGLVCGGGVCVVAAAATGFCDATHPCTTSVICEDNVNTCVAALGVDQVCDPSDDLCDQVHGLFCEPLGMRCTPVMFAPTGACGTTNAGFVVCTRGGVCVGANPRCVPSAADGARCDDSAGPRCLAPATCSGGTCVVKNEYSCL
jgi:hypothetical protein